MQKKKVFLYCILGIVLFLLFVFIEQCLYINKIDKEGDQNYIEAELLRIEEENRDKMILLESLQENPYAVEENKMTEEEKEAYLESFFANEENLTGEKEINDYMMELNDEKADSIKISVDRSLSLGMIADAINQADIALEVYDLNNYIDIMNYLKNVQKLEFLFDSGKMTSYGASMNSITDLEVYIHAFTKIDKYLQNSLIKFKDSEIIPYSDKVEILSIEKSSPRNDMNADLYMSSLKNISGHKVIAKINDSEYAFYFLKNTMTGQLTLYKTLFAHQKPDEISKNSYSAYDRIGYDDDESMTYGTPVKEG